jgi:regulator of sirC expression with transglutaminase-like and TPR domain
MSTWEQTAQHLAHALARPEEATRVAEVALLIATGEWPDLDTSAPLAVLDQHAHEVRALLGEQGVHTPMEEVAALNDVLFDRCGYAGDAEDYYAADNSYLHRVIERRRGMPITLSVIYSDVAQRAGIPIAGIGFPGHFLVQYRGVIPRLLIDPFNRGRIMTASRCMELVRATFGEPRPLEPHMFDEATSRDVILRILRNLKGTFLRAEDFPRARGVLDCLLILDPGSLGEWRERGLVRIKQENARGALSDLRYYAAHADPGPDVDEVEDLIASIRAHLARLN